MEQSISRALLRVMIATVSLYTSDCPLICEHISSQSGTEENTLEKYVVPLTIDELVFRFRIGIGCLISMFYLKPSRQLCSSFLIDTG